MHDKFSTTQWTLLEQVSHGSEADSTWALETICRQYWPPVYAYVRGRGYSVPDAQDAVQSFFLNLLEGDVFKRADASKGRLRTFLLTVLERHLASGWRRHYAEKRGGGEALLSFDEIDAEGWYENVRCSSSSEPTYDYQWAMFLVRQSMKSLQDLYRERGMGMRFDALKPYLEWDDALETPEAYSEVAESLGMTEGAVKVAVFRLRNQYRKILTEKVTITLTDNSAQEARDELVYLMQAIASSGKS